MNKKSLIALSVAGVIVAGGGVAAWSVGNQTTRDSSAAPIIGSSNTVAAPTRTAAPTLKPKPTPTVAPASPGDTEQGTDDTSDEMFDISPWTDTAGAAAKAYLTWDTAEPAKSRTARLTPLFTAGADELTSVPAPAGEDNFSFVGFTSTVAPTIDYVGVEGPSVDGKTINLTVMTSYTAHWKSAIDAQENADKATFTATMSVKDPKRVISLTQQ